MKGDIPTKMLIKTHDIISTYLSRFYNEAKQENKFPKSLKMADLLPIHKKDEKTLAKDYRPVSLITVVS